MSTQSSNSPTQKDLPKDQEEETKQNPQEQSNEEAKEDTNVATSVPLSFAVRCKKLKEAFLLLGNPGFLSASDDEKEDTSPPETNVHSSTSAFILKPRTLRFKNLSSASASSTPPPDSATPSKRPFIVTGNDEDDSQGKEKKKKEEPHGGDTKKPKEVEPLEPYLIVGTEISLLRHILDYYSQKEVYPFDDSKDFMTDWLGVDVEVSDLEEEINKLKKKYGKPAEEIRRILNAMGNLDYQAFVLAHGMWSTECKTEFHLDDEQRMTDEEISRKYHKESMSILEAETIFLESFAKYFEYKGTLPFDGDNGRDDFIRNWVQIDDPADKFTQIIEALRRNYEKKVGKMLKNVGILGHRDRVAFGLATNIWNNK